jgi:RNA polymerase sigma factor (sigma-70 family)
LPAPAEIVGLLESHAEHGSLRRLARMLRVDLAEATQQAIVRALAGVEKYRPERGKLDSWLFVLLRNEIIQANRDARRHRVRSLTNRRGEDREVPDKRQKEILQELVTEERTAGIKKFLETADSFVQDVARLRMTGLTFDQVAERIGVRKSVVVGRWFAWCRAVRKDENAVRMGEM